MSPLVDELAEKTIKKYIGEEIWLKCNLFDYYMYLEYCDEGGYGSIHKVMDRFTGEHLILKKSTKKNYSEGYLEPYFKSNLTKIDKKILLNTNYLQHFKPEIKPCKEAEFMAKVYQKLGGIQLYDYYDDNDYYIMIMKNGGRSLESIASSHKKKILDLMRYNGYKSNFFYRTYLKKVIDYMVKIYLKIKDIHDLGIHHNDLKPENILISEDNDVIIIDFGVAKPVEQSYGKFKGTLEYMPYEFVKYGSYKPWDHTIWCFGIMLHFLTLMKYPFLKEEDILEHNLNHMLINKLPLSFSSFINDCLHKDPSKRPQDLLNRLINLQVYINQTI